MESTIWKDRKRIKKSMPNRKSQTEIDKTFITDDHVRQIKDRDYFYKKVKRTLNEDDWNIAKYKTKPAKTLEKLRPTTLYHN